MSVLVIAVIEGLKLNLCLDFIVEFWERFSRLRWVCECEDELMVILCLLFVPTQAPGTATDMSSGFCQSLDSHHSLILTPPDRGEIGP